MPPRYYKPIGQIAAGWNLTEALVSSIIWHVHKIKSPPVGRLYTSRPSAVEKLKIFKLSLEKYVNDPGVKARMLKLWNEATRLRERRNTFVHGLWGRMPNEHKTWKVFYLRDTDDTDFMRRETVTVPQLTAVAAQIRQLNKDLKKLMREMGAPPP